MRCVKFDLILLEVHVLPVEPIDFALPESAKEGDDYARPNLIVASVKEAARFVRR